MTISLDNIFPLIVPTNYYVKGVWELPHYSLPNQSFILTWVVFGSVGSMIYLTQEQYQELNNKYNGWQQKSFENLRKSIAVNENFFSQFKTDEGGKQLLWICFMNSDGIGSSRILLSNELTKAFPNGYYVAFPDRSCGLVIANEIGDKDLKEIKDIIKSMYKGATTAMYEHLHSSSDFVLPESWTQPIDLEFSEILTTEILKLT
jgi:hypothetical protein